MKEWSIGTPPQSWGLFWEAVKSKYRLPYGTRHLLFSTTEGDMSHSDAEMLGLANTTGDVEMSMAASGVTIGLPSSVQETLARVGSVFWKPMEVLLLRALLVLGWLVEVRGIKHCSLAV